MKIEVLIENRSLVENCQIIISDILARTRNVSQKSKSNESTFFSKTEILVKNQNSGPKLKF